MISTLQKEYTDVAPGKKEAEKLYLINYLLHLADDALILGHRNSEWCGHGPVLELDIAIANIALDLIGQARNFYQYAAEVINGNNETALAQSNKTTGDKIDFVTEDTLAYLRDAAEFKNCLLVEQPNGDWGVTMVKQFFFSTYQYYLYSQLQYSHNARIAGIAAKALKEVTYHVRWSGEWVIRLGCGTTESHSRMLAAVNKLQEYTNEFFVAAEYEASAAVNGYGVDVAMLKPLWLKKIREVFAESGLLQTLPFTSLEGAKFGKTGQHTENLYTILAEMQFLQRTYPGVQW
jgi:ring-1,2-phenylacetyl-CoA epoxidase subunit PaaC